jgi:hypothetical protein
VFLQAPSAYVQRICDIDRLCEWAAESSTLVMIETMSAPKRQMIEVSPYHFLHIEKRLHDQFPDVPVANESQHFEEEAHDS